MIALCAGRHMPAERLGSAGLNGGHHFELTETDMTRIGPPPRRAVHAKDVSYLQLRALTRERVRQVRPFTCSNGLVILPSVFVATWV